MLKRILATLLVVSLFGISIACSEEAAANVDFADGFLAWTKSLDLNRTDYHGQVVYNGIPSVDTTLRKDGGLTELAISNLGRVQISDQTLALEINGQKYYVDLASIMDTVMPLLEGEQSYSEDLEMAGSWLEKALQQVVLPCLKVSFTERGMLIHLEASDEIIRERAYTLIDELMADRQCVEGLLKKYSGILSLFIPDMPETFEELEAAWISEKENHEFYWRDFDVSADITYSRNNQEIQMSGEVSLYIQWLFGIDLSFELASEGETIDLLADIDLTNYRDYIRSASNKLEFHCQGNRLYGTLKTRDMTYSLNAEKETEENKQDRYVATLTGKQYGKFVVKYDLDALYDSQANSLKATVYETQDIGTSYESQKELMDLECYKRIMGWDVNLKLPYDICSMHFSFGKQYSRLKIESTGYAFNYVYLDASPTMQKKPNKLIR